MAKTFRPWDVEQRWLLPPSVNELVPEDHLAHFIRDTFRDELDLSEIMSAYDEERGFPPFHPVMMSALLKALPAHWHGAARSRVPRRHEDQSQRVEAQSDELQPHEGS